MNESNNAKVDLNELRDNSPEKYAALMKKKRYSELGWYVLYVVPQHERLLLETFTQIPDPFRRKTRAKERSIYKMEEPIEAFVPIRVEKHRWSDRIKIIPVVMTPGIIFVRIRLCDRQKLFVNDKVVKFLYDKDKGEAARIPDEIMETFRNSIDSIENLTLETPQQGSTVMIKRGPFKGYVGTVVKELGREKFQLRLNYYMALSFSVDLNDLEVVPEDQLDELPDTLYV